MYSCSGTGIKGSLIITIQNGKNLPDRNTVLTFYKPYVKVTAVHKGGKQVVKKTDYKLGTDVEWNQKLEFGGNEWLYYRIQVFDDTGTTVFEEHTKLTIPETVPITDNPHLHNYFLHCKEPDDCSGYIRYDYDFYQDCLSNPCQNGGTCDYTFSSYTCKCPSDYEGKNCQYYRVPLSVYVESGKNLHDKDNYWFSGESDPYVKVVAYDQNGGKVTKTTKVVLNSSNPKWKEKLNFGTRVWKKMKIRVYDYDLFSGDDTVSDWKTYDLILLGSFSGIKMPCYKGGKIVFNYTFGK